MAFGSNPEMKTLLIAGNSCKGQSAAKPVKTGRFNDYGVKPVGSSGSETQSIQLILDSDIV